MTYSCLDPNTNILSLETLFFSFERFPHFVHTDLISVNTIINLFDIDIIIIIRDLTKHISLLISSMCFTKYRHKIHVTIIQTQTKPC